MAQARALGRIRRARPADIPQRHARALPPRRRVSGAGCPGARQPQETEEATRMIHSHPPDREDMRRRLREARDTFVRTADYFRGWTHPPMPAHVRLNEQMVKVCDDLIAALSDPPPHP